MSYFSARWFRCWARAGYNVAGTKRAFHFTCITPSSYQNMIHIPEVLAAFIRRQLSYLLLTLDCDKKQIVSKMRTISSRCPRELTHLPTSRTKVLRALKVCASASPNLSHPISAVTERGGKAAAANRYGSMIDAGIVAADLCNTRHHDARGRTRGWVGRRRKRGRRMFLPGHGRP